MERDLAVSHSDPKPPSSQPVPIPEAHLAIKRCRDPSSPDSMVMPPARYSPKTPETPRAGILSTNEPVRNKHPSAPGSVSSRLQGVTLDSSPGSLLSEQKSGVDPSITSLHAAAGSQLDSDVALTERFSCASDSATTADGSIHDISKTSPQTSKEKEVEYLQRVQTWQYVAYATYYIVGASWLNKWSFYVNGELPDAPGPVDNSELFINENELQPNLMEELDYKAVDEETWFWLSDKYGVLNDAHILTRIALMSPLGTVRIDIQSQQIKVINEAAEFLVISFIKQDTWSDILDRVASEWSIPESELKLVIKKYPVSLKAVTDLQQEIQTDLDEPDCFLEVQRIHRLDSPVSTHANDVVMDSPQESVATPILQPSKALVSPPRFAGLPSERRSHLPIGATGLNNLGNTCFMNSALQCLSNTIPLTSYFLSEKWKNELNTDNPMGMRGEIAEHYAKLVFELWNVLDHRGSSFSPRDFKYTIGQFNSMFSGYGQQDSQELLGTLLDGLHEDLNRIKKKPYVEVPDMDDEPHSVIANKMWEIYKMRNDSVIVDYFQGEYRSIVECRVCGKRTVKFDPYMFLTLPIPEQPFVTIKLKIIPKQNPVASQAQERPFSFAIRVDKNADISTLKKRISVELGWCSEEDSGQNVVILELFQNRIYKTLQDYDPARALCDNNDIYAYQLDECDYDLFYVSPDVGSTYIPIYFTTKTGYSAQLFGLPVMLTVPKKWKLASSSPARELGCKMYRLVVSAMQRFSLVNVFDNVAASNPSQQEVPTDNLPSMPISGDVGKEDEPVSNLFKLNLYKASTGGGYGYDFYGHGWRNVSPLCLYDPEKLKTVQPQVSSSTSSIDSTSAASSESKMDEDAPKESVAESDIEGTIQADEAPAKEPSSRSEDIDLEGDWLLVMEWNETMAKTYFGATTTSQRYLEPSSGTNPFEVIQDAAYLDWLRADDERTRHEQAKPISLQDCLNEFTKEETMGEQDTYYCSQCKEHQMIKKTIDIWSAPEILVLSLKRFSNAGRSVYGSFGGSKIDSLVDFPIKGLDFSEFVIGEGFEERNFTKMNSSIESLGVMEKDQYIYDLFAVSNHIGATGGGHYTAYAKNAMDDQWYLFDDSRVSPVENTSRIVSREAYLLFYQRRKDTHRNKQKLKSHIEQIKLRPAPPPPGAMASPPKYSPPKENALVLSDASAIRSSHITLSSFSSENGSTQNAGTPTESVDPPVHELVLPEPFAARPGTPEGSDEDMFSDSFDTRHTLPPSPEKMGR